MKRNTKVLLLHNIPAPYRLPLFEQVAKKVDLQVFFCKKSHKRRLWETNFSKYNFKRKILKNFSLRPFVFNFTLPWELLKNKSDIYLVGENGFETMFSIFWVFLVSKIYKKSLIIWSGKFETEWTRQQLKGIRKYAELVLSLYRKFLYHNASAFIAYSTKAKEYLVKRGVSEEKIFIGGQVMPEELLQEVNISKQDTEYKDKTVILTISYLSKRKGIDYLIEAFKGLNFKNTVLIIGGTGEEERNLKLLAGNNPNIYFVGYVDGFEKFRLYSIADIFVLPTLYDPWGLVVNEAMYFGLPIIVTDAAGCSEMIKDNGLVVPPADREGLREAIKVLVENKSLREKMGRRSKEIAQCSLWFSVRPFLESIRWSLGHIASVQSDV